MRRLWGALICVLLLGSCAKESAEISSPKLPKLEYARLLRMESGRSYSVAEFINPSDSTAVTARYLLVQKEVTAAQRDSLAAAWPDAITLEVPVKNMLVYSSVQGRAFVELGKPDAIGGIVDKQYFNVPELKDDIDSGKITDCGSASLPSKEKVLAMQPSAVLLSLYEGMDVGGVDKLAVPLIKLVDNLESTPLGRAEWLRFLAALVGESRHADRIFRETVANYNKIKWEASRLEKRPKVLTDNIYLGVWYLPAGESFAAQLIVDAGGDYPWKDTEGAGSLALSYEEVYQKALDADVWLMRVFDKELTAQGLAQEDSRYSNFNALNQRKIWFANSKVSPVFEEANYHPDRLLADYARIFRAVSCGEQPDSIRYFKQIK